MGGVEAGLLEIDLGAGGRDALDVVGTDQSVRHPDEDIPIRHRDGQATAFDQDLLNLLVGKLAGEIRIGNFGNGLGQQARPHEHGRRDEQSKDGS